MAAAQAWISSSRFSALANIGVDFHAGRMPPSQPAHQGGLAKRPRRIRKTPWAIGETSRTFGMKGCIPLRQGGASPCTKEVYTFGFRRYIPLPEGGICLCRKEVYLLCPRVYTPLPRKSRMFSRRAKEFSGFSKVFLPKHGGGHALLRLAFPRGPDRHMNFYGIETVVSYGTKFTFLFHRNPSVVRSEDRVSIP